MTQSAIINQFSKKNRELFNNTLTALPSLGELEGEGDAVSQIEDHSFSVKR